jgi:DNA-binding response OmpR family regulator
MKILVCEDEDSVRRVIQLQLTSHGHSVDLAYNAEEAIALFEAAHALEAPEGGAPYDLIVTDIALPGCSGFLLCGHVRARGYKGRIAVMTGAPIETMMANLAYVQAEYWPKPAAIGDILHLVESGVNTSENQFSENQFSEAIQNDASNEALNNEEHAHHCLQS